MPLWKVAFRSAWPGVVSALGMVVMAACGGEYPQSTLAPKGDFAGMVDVLFMTTVKWAVVVFVLVECALLYIIWRFRRKPGDGEPKQIHGNALLELIWTIIPALVLFFIAIPTVRTIFRTAEVPADALEIEVIGHQWWWEFRYPDERIVSATEMHVPAGRTVALRIRTADVLHSFWVPQLAAKRDALPNKYTTLWFTTDSVGAFPGQCAEFCGLQHGRMASLVVVEPPEGYAAWVARQQRGSPLNDGGRLVYATPDDSAAASADSILVQGRRAFLSAGCVGCHAMAGTPTAGLLNLTGPNLTHLGERRTLAGGMLPNTPENLARWLREPQVVKQGSLMRLARPLAEDEISALVAYLRARQ